MNSSSPGDPSSGQAGPVRPHHLQRLALVYIRQSTADQVRSNTGSTAAQRDLAGDASRLGWPDSKIRVIDSDLGLSGTSVSKRTGFLEVQDLMDRGEVGIVLVQDLSRLARRNSTIAHFIDLAAETDTLIFTNGVVYDPASDDLAASLGLQLSGAFGAYDNRVRARRMMAARVAKAKRGHAVSPPPVGFVRGSNGQWIKDPDEKIQEAVTRVFDLYRRLGSLGKVVKYMRAHDLRFPRRRRGEINWAPLDAALLDNTLRHPAYAGDYHFLRHRPRSPRRGADVRRPMHRPLSERIEVKNHHEAYVPREVWDEVQRLLHSRRPGDRPMVGKGTAWLQGLLRCGACQRWMRTHYWGRDGVARTATYVCRRTDGWGATTHKVSFPALFADHAVASSVLEALSPIGADTVRTVVEAAHVEHAALERDRRRRLDAVQDEVDRHREVLVGLSPEHARARAEIATKLEEAVARRDEVKAELSRNPLRAVAFEIDDMDEFVAIARNVRHLWQSPRTTHEDRKRLLHTAISEVIVRAASKEAVDLEIVWAGGLREPLRVLRPRGVDAFVRERTAAGRDPRTITEELNAAGVVTASGRPMSLNVVSQKIGHAGLRLKEQRLKARNIIRNGLIENLPRPQILLRLRDEVPRLGPWDPQRLSDEIRQLRDGVPGIEPLPEVLPAELQKNHVLAVIEKGIGGGETWKTIVRTLNESGLRPPRGSAFTPVQVRLLYMRSHGLRSFKLPAQRKKAHQ